MSHCFFLDTGEHSAAYNMACDELLLNKVKADGDLVFFRVYGWSQPAFSLGQSQRLERELDIKKCRAAGYDIVRRPTGGRLVLHKRELAYTFVVEQANLAERQKYSLLVGKIFVSVLQNLSVSANLVATGEPPRFAKSAPSLCFTHMATHEVMVNDKKIMGRAFREKGRYRLEQGFLLLQNDYRELPEFLPGSTLESYRQLQQEIGRKTTSLHEVLGKNIAFAALSNLLYAQAQRMILGPWTDDELTKDDEECIQGLMAQKYANEGWLHKY